MLAIWGLGDCREATNVGNSFKMLMKPYTQSQKKHTLIHNEECTSYMYLIWERSLSPLATYWPCQWLSLSFFKILFLVRMYLNYLAVVWAQPLILLNLIKVICVILGKSFYLSQASISPYESRRKQTPLGKSSVQSLASKRLLMNVTSDCRQALWWFEMQRWHHISCQKLCKSSLLQSEPAAVLSPLP